MSDNACTDLAQRMLPGMPPSMTRTCPVIDAARQNMTICAARAEPSMFEAESFHRCTETRLLLLLRVELFRLRLSRYCYKRASSCPVSAKRGLSVFLLPHAIGVGSHGGTPNTVRPVFDPGLTTLGPQSNQPVHRVPARWYRGLGRRAAPQELISRLCLIEKASSMVGVEKPAEEEPSGQRFVAWVVRHQAWPHDRRIQPVEETGVFRNLGRAKRR